METKSKIQIESKLLNQIIADDIQAFSPNQPILFNKHPGANGRQQIFKIVQ
jgi:hypothetical protein